MDLDDFRKIRQTASDPLPAPYPLRSLSWQAGPPEAAIDCTICKFDGKLSRTKRAGLLEERIYPYFGYFPWICSLCKRRILLKNRGDRRRISRDPEPGAAPEIQYNEKSLHQNG